MARPIGGISQTNIGIGKTGDVPQGGGEVEAAGNVHALAEGQGLGGQQANDGFVSGGEIGGDEGGSSVNLAAWDDGGGGGGAARSGRSGP